MRGIARFPSLLFSASLLVVLRRFALGNIRTERSDLQAIDFVVFDSEGSEESIRLHIKMPSPAKSSFGEVGLFFPRQMRCPGSPDLTKWHFSGKPGWNQRAEPKMQRLRKCRRMRKHYRGRVAQLGEHLLCKQGVAGSNPVTSTIQSPDGGQHGFNCADIVS
jgi:hypothetical protein